MTRNQAGPERKGAEESGTADGDAGRRYRHPDWEDELISYPGEVEGAPGGVGEVREPEAPRFTPQEIAPPLGEIALRAA